MKEQAETVTPVVEPVVIAVSPISEWKIRILDNSTYVLTEPLTNKEIFCSSLDIENILRN